ncbi:MAG: hypothetical protein H8E45_11060 [Proteobacteria bacterium]|nr:hypothetical protein [Pseudomonadota bacterium]
MVDKSIDGEVSGKLFRFLSAMHPSLSRAERQSFAEYDADSWYPWNEETASRFNELMRSAPRDSSFARGFAYVAQKAIPEGRYLSVPELLEYLDRLPAAFRGEYGSGFEARLEEPFKARISYAGMPGFANSCIAVAGELAQRLQASGGKGVRVRHVEGCRLQDEERCNFEVTWKSEADPRGVELVAASSLLGEEAPDLLVPETDRDLREPVSAENWNFSDEALPGDNDEASLAQEIAPAREIKPPAEPVLPPVQESLREPAEAQVAASTAGGLAEAGLAEAVLSGNVSATSGDDLFGMLKQRLEVADRQAALYEQARGEIDLLRGELNRAGEEHRRALDEAEQRISETRVQLAALKDNIRKLVSDH